MRFSFMVARDSCMDHVQRTRRLNTTHLNSGLSADGLIFNPELLRGGGGMPPLSDSWMLLCF